MNPSRRKSLNCFVLELFCVLFFVCSPCVCQQSIGDSCVVERGGQDGTCQLLADCPVVQNEKLLYLEPTKCGDTSQYEDILCCPNTESTATTTTTTTTSITTEMTITTEKPPHTLNRTSQRKCAKYREASKQTLFISIDFDEDIIEKDSDKCELASVPFVVGGDFAKSKEFPHMAAIGYNTDGGIAWACGGSLISEYFVLTAAHCVYEKEYGLGLAQYVLLGDLIIDDKTDTESRPIRANIAERIPHPDFKYPSKYNDIALFRLDREIEFNRVVRPACLADRYQPHTPNAIASGWGETENGTESNKSLMKVILEIFSNQECNSAYTANNTLPNVIFDEQQICAGSHKHQKDTCHGDSGGPLQVNHPFQYCMYEVVGVTSFGKKCGDMNTPGVYTRVFDYLDWIEGIVWP